MADQRGRCVNVEFCSVAVARRIVSVAEGAPFVCERCSEPLESAAATRVVGGKRLVVGLQVMVVLIFGGALAYKFSSNPVSMPRQDTELAGDSAGVGSAPIQSSDLTPSTAIAAAEPPGLVQPPAPTTAKPALPVPRDGEAATIAMAAGTPVTEVTPSAASLGPVLPEPAPPQSVLTASMSTMFLPPAAAIPASVRPDTPPMTMAPTTLLLRIAASDPVASKLTNRLASGYLTMIGDSNIVAEPGGPAGALDVFGMQTGQRELIKIATTSAADIFNDLRRGAVDVAISFRRKPALETKGLQAAGAVTTRGNDPVIAVQGVGIVVSPINPVTSLTTDQMRDILTGRIVNWSELRGRDAKINLHLLDGSTGFGDSDQDLLLLPAGSALREANRVPTESELAAAVADDPDGLGLVTAGNAGRARLVAVGKDGGPPVLPSNMALATEEYPLTRRLYLYTGGDGRNAFVRRFEEYVMSPAGQAAIEAAGFAILSVKNERVVAPEAGSDRLRQLITGATRVSSDLRFHPGSVQLDARSVRELDRLVALLKSQGVSASRVILAGFTDNNGPSAANLAVSQQRAQSVTAILARYGIVPGETVGFGSDQPIGDNATPDGRERNRRVEVYLAP